MTNGQKALHEIKAKNNFTQNELAEALETSQTNISQFLNGKPLTKPIALKMRDKFGCDYDEIILVDNFDKFLNDVPKKEVIPSVMDQLNKIKSKKSEDKNENKVVSKDEIINIKTYIIPIKGFSNLKTAFYSDEYISQNFEETTTEVPKHLYSPISYKIQSSGKSMPDSIPEDAWVTGVPVDEMLWQNYKFLENKIYILFHWDKGIFFKYVKNLSPNKIELSSQNPDKQNYGSETFNLGDFRKILLAIKVETFI